MASIRFDGVTKRYKDGTLAVDDLRLDIPDGEFLILVGPSGCGKTTALRMLAGLEEISEGEIVLGDRVINDVEPGDRDVAMIFQNYALFPHMTVYDNMAFPLRMRRVAKKEVAEGVRAAAQLLGLGELLRRRPNQLSGGQRQRVAMGRAIVRQPAAFLMDEPLSNLDAKLRTQMRGELARMHRRLGTTTLYVTHDQTEAMTLGSRVAVMRNGIVQQVGAPQELYRNPANAFVARFIGSPPMNVMRGALEDGRLRVTGQEDGAGVDVGGRWPGQTREVLVGIRPEDWRLGAEPAPGEALTLRGEVEVVEELGAETIVYFRHAAAAVDVAGEDDGIGETFAARSEGGGRLPAPGDRVAFHASASALHVFDAGTGEAVAAPLHAASPAA
ncbi:ABC transporter ATP-binding protein [Conexibacter stalactiti]|uniref:ABC transporter ATP-binding protein n=1 Tax=Conexibacter stalactiti TaxID=1940611 RepID=A0ABU4HPU7_9ACTN|nr:ABC transporter ATP-binding protein [Conexibacter stalactiti]MDW5594079.1 ABC transporter ATP-binding protein [Conexibacter stalactiti]MEC5034721.1 ABC transporter ATP-binding protein [Conexibacter stalactiti]